MLATALVLVVLWILPGCFSGMHDSDQAAVLGDAWHLAGGGRWEPGVFYNYDKLFVTHWLLAGLFWILRQVGGNDVVLVGNLAVSVLATGAVLALQSATRFRGGSYAAFLAVLLAPTFLLHVPFMAPALVSAGFLWLLGALLEKSRGRRRLGHYLAIAALTLAAVGARADAVLALPFIVWLHVPLGRWPWRVGRARMLPALIAGVIGAALISLQLRDQDVVYSGEWAFNTKVFAAFLLFGLGGALPLLGWTALRMAALIFRRGARPRLGWALGLAALALPFAFYALQLYSTRYWTLGLTLLLLSVASRRGQVLVAGRWGRVVVVSSLLAAVIPLGVGCVLESPGRRPRLVARDATAFPSADGLIPMGAFLTYDFAPRDSSTGGARDHNHAVWLAARNATFLPANDGRVRALVTPTYSILRLAILLQGQQIQGFKLFEIPAVCYADTRSLIKYPRPLAAHEQADDPMSNYVAAARIEPASPAFRGIAIQRVEKDAGTTQQRPVWDVFRAIFRGDDFWPRESSEVWNRDGMLRVTLRRGATVAVLSDKPFTLEIIAPDGSMRRMDSTADAAFPAWQAVIIDGRSAAQTVRVVAPSSPSGVFYSAEAVLPDYMSQARSGP